MVAIPRGHRSTPLGHRASIFLVGGALHGRGADRRPRPTGQLARVRARAPGTAVIPVAGLAFSLGGVLMQMQEELIAFVPVAPPAHRHSASPRRRRRDEPRAPRRSAPRSVPVNPFQVGIAQKVARLPPALRPRFPPGIPHPGAAIWICWHDALRRPHPSCTCRPESGAASPLDGREVTRDPVIRRGRLRVFIYGVQRLDWEFDQLAALFFVDGRRRRTPRRLRLAGTADAFVDGFNRWRSRRCSSALPAASTWC